MNLFTIAILFCCICGGWILGYATCFAMVKGSDYDDNHELLLQVKLLDEDNDKLDLQNAELKQKNLQLHVELDALKAHTFPVEKKA